MIVVWKWGGIFALWCSCIRIINICVRKQLRCIGTTFEQMEKLWKTLGIFHPLKRIVTFNVNVYPPPLKIGIVYFSRFLFFSFLFFFFFKLCFVVQHGFIHYITRYARYMLCGNFQSLSSRIWNEVLSMQMIYRRLYRKHRWLFVYLWDYYVKHYANTMQINK